MNDFSKALNNRFNLEAPESYKALESHSGLLWKDEYRGSELNESNIPYFWLNDMEWYQATEIENFEFEEYHKPGFIPFAHTGGGDYWCWSPPHETNSEIPVLLCPHDCEEAEFYAPNFSSALFRHALEYSASIDEDELELLKATLTKLLSYFSEIWDDQWVEKIKEVSSTPLTWNQYEHYIEHEFGKDFIERTIIWTK
ncbi:SMI1/KNR4 family protein [Cerasicoccus arenae]|uniref:Knr4/Smi1-like domain-containing protein n=1 Tax=Cerasicoccus arenae TaxID=424488 RepID=A0A8J3DKM0_9BACT|nr:SMI1/KNR4 family protein [Cerasicoccus arenae]MBK1859480.1 SMI1/KNR4 family protein [Cerasicoccus arenae]GHC10898.1 hypothetical protein GCM10007047_30330 [Cerasicoccus arenae]